jgi:hypothetical protein
MGAVVGLIVCCGAPVLAGAPGSREACEAAGGRWGRFGLRQQELCDLPTPDGGKACLDVSDCASTCVAPKAAAVGSSAEGTCYPRAILLGTCLKYVRGGVVAPPMCTD